LIEEHTRREMSDSSTSATDYSPGMAAVAGEKGEKKGKNKVGSELAASLAAAEEVEGLAVAKKWRVPQDLIDEEVEGTAGSDRLHPRMGLLRLHLHDA
jgi:hypothetical protein